MASPDPIDALLGAALRAEPAPWPEAWSSDAAEAALLEHADYHGVASLVLPAAAEWPAPVREALRSRAMLRAAWELQHRARLLALLAELEARGAASLFLKGTALAYSVYDQPAQRQRADSDLLVAKSDIEAARAALAAAGFARPEADAQASGALQESWTVVEAGFHHTIDLHWAVFNTPRLAAVLPAEACLAAAVPLPALAPTARMLEPAQFLLHLCVHRNLHRTAPYFSGGRAWFGADRLIWAKDIALLAARFDEPRWRRFIDLAGESGIGTAMAEALRFAANAGGSKVAGDVLAALERQRPGPTAAYLLRSGRRRRALANWLAEPGWRARLRRLRALAAPPDAALRRRYPGLEQAPRLLLITRRLADFLGLGRATDGTASDERR